MLRTCLNYPVILHMVEHSGTPAIQALWKWRKKDLEFKAGVGYIVRFVSKQAATSQLVFDLFKSGDSHDLLPMPVRFRLEYFTFLF